MILWPEALSNWELSSFSGPVMAPPARTWSSAACALAIGGIATATPASINKATLYLFSQHISLILVMCTRAHTRCST